MLVGKIDFNHPNKRLCIISFDNIITCLQDYYYERHHFILKCRNCGIMLVPFLDNIGPNNSGWKREKVSSGWLCHWCSYEPIGDVLKEQKIRARAKNAITKNKLIVYKMTHPWVKYKKR